MAYKTMRQKYNKQLASAPTCIDKVYYWGYNEDPTPKPSALSENVEDFKNAWVQVKFVPYAVVGDFYVCLRLTRLRGTAAWKLTDKNECFLVVDLEEITADR